ncbi:MAG TPA: hypothetical protein VK843_12890 [Planctomycetota bacterium]|nr:hypothetical protein [Planctomycetota bacterium]
MELSYVRMKDGSVNLCLGKEWPGFNQALADSISSTPPRGSKETSISTYWIDEALRETEHTDTASGSRRFQGGNSTSFRLEGSTVRASSDYELFDDETMPVEQFRSLLVAWRVEVERLRSIEPIVVSETYRRNPSR